eukprot:scaffold214_cov249-Pinguiococcus_pyrenoidosus.AAC.10
MLPGVSVHEGDVARSPEFALRNDVVLGPCRHRSMWGEWWRPKRETWRNGMGSDVACSQTQPPCSDDDGEGWKDTPLGGRLLAGLADQVRHPAVHAEERGDLQEGADGEEQARRDDEGPGPRSGRTEAC